MKLNFINNRLAEFNDEKFELNGQFEHLGNGAFHIMMNNNYRYFTISDITINGAEVKSVADFINFFIG